MKTSSLLAVALFFQSFICHAEEFKGPIRFSVEEKSANGKVKSKLFDELPFEAWSQAETLKNLVNDVGVINGQVKVEGYDANTVPLSELLSIAGFSRLHECLKEGVAQGVTSREQILENQKSCVEKLNNKELAQFVINSNYLDAKDLLSLSKEALKQRIHSEMQGSLDAYHEWLLATEKYPDLRFNPQFVLDRNEFMQFLTGDFYIHLAMKKRESNKSKLVGEFSGKAFSEEKLYRSRVEATLEAHKYTQRFGAERLLAFSNDGTRLAAMRNIPGRDSAVQVFDVQTGKANFYSESGKHTLLSFALSSDGQYLAFAGGFGLIKFVDSNEKSFFCADGDHCQTNGPLAYSIPSLEHKTSWGWQILSLGFSPKDDRGAFSFVDNGTVKCGIFHLGTTSGNQDVILDTGYRVKNGNFSFKAPFIVMNPIEFGGNDTVTCSSDQFTSVFDLKSRERISFAEKNSQAVSRKIFKNASFFEKKESYSGTLDGGEIGISLQSKKNKYEVSQFALSPDGLFLAELTLDDKLRKPFMGSSYKYESSPHERIKIWKVDLDKTLKSEINKLSDEQAYLLLLMFKHDLNANDLKKFPHLRKLYQSMKSVTKRIL